jgi:uncharacterized protein YndB with AHSA1/START domain
MPTPADSASELHELLLTRLIDAPPAALFRAWTDPAVIRQWFTPPPFTVSHAEADVRVGGSHLVVMRGPDGTEYPNRGVYLEVVPDAKLVFTDAYTSAWVPSAKPFMTVTLTFAAEGAGTRYTARVLHWSAADREAHEQMGFRQGWGTATDQLQALLQPSARRA